VATEEMIAPAGVSQLSTKRVTVAERLAVVPATLQEVVEAPEADRAAAVAVVGDPKAVAATVSDRTSRCSLRVERR